MFDSDYIHVDDTDVTAIGFDIGAKGRLLTVGAALHSADSDGRIVGCVTLLADRDFDDAVPPDVGAFVLYTDGFSLENYAYDPAVIDRFIGIYCQRSVTASGAAPLRGDDMLERIGPPCIVLAAIRRTLLQHRRALIDHWLDDVRVDKEGRVEVRTRRLLSSALAQHGPDVDAETGVANAEAVVASDPFRYVRGHDFVSVFHKVLKSPWGKRVTGINFGTTHTRQIRGLLLLSIDTRALAAQPMFASLERRLAAW